MATMVVDLNVVKHLVLAELGHRALRPTDLLTILGDRYPDTVVKEAVLRLLKERSIEMTADQQLEIAEAA